MDNEIKAWLADIETTISEIYQFVPNRSDFEAFQQDLKTKRAVERNIEIIGEAMNRILKLKPDFPIQIARKIIDTSTPSNINFKRIISTISNKTVLQRNEKEYNIDGTLSDIRIRGPVLIEFEDEQYKLWKKTANKNRCHHR